MPAVRRPNVYTGDDLGDYHFGVNPPFGPARFEAFVRATSRWELDWRTLPGADTTLLEQ